MKHITKLRKAREDSALTVDKGETTPRQDHARGLFKLYKGRVPLANIYDPVFAEQIRSVA